jgi:hypothetical protein
MNGPKHTRQWLTLVAELDTADAMIALMKYTRELEAIRRHQQEALKSYQAALDLVLLVSLSENQEQEVWGRLTLLRHWFESAGLVSATDSDGDKARPPD